MTRAHNEDEASFEAFYAARFKHLVAAMWAVTRDVHEAEEVTQEAFVRVYQRWGRRIDDPEAFLFRAAMNVFRNRLRGRRRGAPDDRVAAGPTVEQVDARDELDRYLLELTPRERAAVVLVRLLDFSSEDAGKVLGVKAGTVRTLVSRAERSLQGRGSG